MLFHGHFFFMSSGVSVHCGLASNVFKINKWSLDAGAWNVGASRLVGK